MRYGTIRGMEVKEGIPTEHMPGETSDIYYAYAPFYDGSGQIRFAVLFAHYLLGDILPRHPVAGRRVLDLACGTGTLALILADAGWQVIGIDRSPAMLAIARNRAQTVEPAFRPMLHRGGYATILADSRPGH
jgi:ubiquinone/menaquinone biosynthesis C-methylase UbiE